MKYHLKKGANNRCYLVLTWVLLTSILCYTKQTAEAQTLSSSKTGGAFSKINIVAPNAASLGKYVDIPVSYYSGIPQISIPIYNVVSGKLSLPLSLDYHAGGIKVQELASWVGLGWTLKAGGVISRQVRGFADEKGAGSNHQYGYLSDGGYLNYIGNYFNGSVVNPEITTKCDGEPDIFTFNFGGISGKFAFNDAGQPMCIPSQDLKIEYVYNSQPWTYDNQYALGALAGKTCIETFIITTTDGTKYYFGKQDSYQPGYSHPIDVHCTLTAEKGINPSRIISSWYLNKIVSQDGQDEINLLYKFDSYSYYSYNTGLNVGTSTLSNENRVLEYEIIKNYVYGSKLSCIKFKNGALYFENGILRNDLGSASDVFKSIRQSSNTQSFALGKIILKNTQNQEVKYWQFTYDYFEDLNASNTGINSIFVRDINIDIYKLKLLKFQEFSASNTSDIMNPYVFSYFAENPVRSLSLNIDHWGFNNYDGRNNTSLLPQLFVLSKDITTPNPKPSNYYNNRDSRWPAMRGGSLKTITYPTKGSIDFEFEPNTVFANNTNVIVGGLRIKKIKKISTQNLEESIHYEYNNPNKASIQSSAILYSIPVYIQMYRNDLLKYIWDKLQIGCYVPKNNPYFASTYSVRPMETTQGMHLGYLFVKEIFPQNGYKLYQYFDDKNSLYSPASNTIYVNTLNSTSCDDNINAPNYPAAPEEFSTQRGHLIVESFFNESQQFIKSLSTRHVYVKTDQEIPGYISNSTSGIIGGVTLYTLKSYKKSHSETTEIIRDPNSQIVSVKTSTTRYSSVFHNEPTQVEFQNSKNETSLQVYKYSYDFLPQEFSMIDLQNAHQTYNYTWFTNFQNTINRYLSDFKYPTKNENINNADYATLFLGELLKNMSTSRKNIQNIALQYFKPNNILQTALNNKINQSNDAFKIILELNKQNENVLISQEHYVNNKPIEATYIEYNKNQYNFIYPFKFYKWVPSQSNASYKSLLLNSLGTNFDLDQNLKLFSTLAFDNKNNLMQYIDRSNIPESYETNTNDDVIVKITNAKHETNSINETEPITIITNVSSNSSTLVKSTLTLNSTTNITVSLGNYYSLSNSNTYTFNYRLNFINEGVSNSLQSGTFTISSQKRNMALTLFSIPAGTYELVLSGIPQRTNPRLGITTKPNFNANFSILYVRNRITTTTYKEFYFEDFETNTSAFNIFAHTGKKSFIQSFTIPFIPPNTKNYILQYWKYVNNKWQLFQQKYTPNTVLNGSNGNIDNIRIFPEDAQMFSYNYHPLFGLTSQIDPQGNVSYFNFDGLGRLKTIKNKNNEFVKSFIYNFSK
ncbi:MAG: hypothetical protein QM539_00890 [Alphaproteobacteria bacterium]|nr:hypothetical protein [Alphaproteobacteria bacterium]